MHKGPLVFRDLSVRAFRVVRDIVYNLSNKCIFEDCQAYHVHSIEIIILSTVDCVEANADVALNDFSSSFHEQNSSLKFTRENIFQNK